MGTSRELLFEISFDFLEQKPQGSLGARAEENLESHAQMKLGRVRGGYDQNTKSAVERFIEPGIVTDGEHGAVNGVVLVGRKGIRLQTDALACADERSVRSGQPGFHNGRPGTRNHVCDRGALRN